MVRDNEEALVAEARVVQVKLKISDLLAAVRYHELDYESYYEEYHGLMDELYWAEDELGLALMAPEEREAELQRRRDSIEDHNTESDNGDMPF